MRCSVVDASFDREWVVKGHGFSRAETVRYQERALAPAGQSIRGMGIAGPTRNLTSSLVNQNMSRILTRNSPDLREAQLMQIDPGEQIFPFAHKHRREG